MLTQVILALATLLGFGLTAGGIVGAFYGAKRELATAEARYETAARLTEEQRADKADTNDPAAARARNARWTAKYAEHDLVRVTYSNENYAYIFETRYLLSTLLESARSNLITAGIGLVVSTLASLGSLFVG